MTDPADDLDATDYNHQLNSQRCYNSCEATNIPSDSVVLSVWNNGRRLLGCVVQKFELFWDAGGPTTPSSILRKAISAILVKSIVSGWNYTDLVLVFFDDFIDNTIRGRGKHTIYQHSENFPVNVTLRSANHFWKMQT